MLFVHDDQPQVWLRGEDGAARPDDHGVVAIADAPPLVELLAQRQTAVHHRHLAGEALGEAPHRLWRQGYLRHQNDAPLAQGHCLLQGLKVDLRLAAAGDAMQEEDAG